MDFNYDTGTISNVLELDPGANNITVLGTSGLILPNGTTAQRDASTGVLRFNTTLSVFEGFDGVQWTTMQVNNANLTSLANLSSTGFVVQTGTGTFAERTITGVSGEVVVTNGNGIAGNVIIALANAGTAGTYVSTTTDQFGRVISGNTTQTWSTITDTPTTLFGYGITDALTGNAGVTGWAAGLLADIPATGNTGAMYYATDTHTMYYDNGTSWDISSAALTGDISTTAGNTVTTLATVNGNVGTFGSTTQIPVVTVNGKGLVTAVSTASISGAINLVGDATGSGSTGGNTTVTLNTVNTNVGLFGSNSQVGTFTVNAKGLVTSAANVTILPEAIGAVNTSVLGQPNGVATLDSSGKLTDSQIPAALVGALQYQGVWDASTNTPTLTSGVGVTGQYYKVSVAGATTIDGYNGWTVGDILAFNGTTWDAIDGLTTEVTSVFGRVGSVTATLASADFANQGTTTTVLHGNANGAPSWGAINLSSDVTGTLPATSFPVLTGDISTTSGNTVTTLATVNSNVGVFGDSLSVGQFTVNGKGLVTQAANVSIPLAVTIGGDATGTGNTSVTTNITLNTVNGNVGTFGSTVQIPVVTVNAKGLVTAVTTASISGNISVTGGDLTMSGSTGTAITNATLATVNSNVGTFGNSSVIPTITVNAKGLVTGVTTSNVSASSIGAVQNAGDTPSIASGAIASLPSAGTLGRVYITTDTHAIYRDNGTTWDEIGESSLLYTENPSSPSASTVLGANAISLGSGNSAGSANALATGAGAATAIYGAEVRANGSFAAAGDAQTGKYILRNTTSNATQTEVFLDGSSARIVLPNNSAMTYSALIVARRTDATGSEGAWKIEGLISRDANAASTALIGNRSKTVLTRPAGWDTEVFADTTNGALTFKVTGQSGNTIRWVCTVITSEVA
jgi:hypothetical protein